MLANVTKPDRTSCTLVPSMMTQFYMSIVVRSMQMGGVTLAS